MMEPDSSPSSGDSSPPRGADPSRSGERQALPWGQNAELELHAGAAAVTVTPLPEGGAPYLVTRGPVEARIREHGRITRVELEARESGFLAFLKRNTPSVELFVPANVHARLSLDAGAVRVSGLKDCVLELSTEAGTADVRDVHGRLSLRTGAGSIFGERLGGTLNVHTGAGTVKLEVDALEAGEHRIVSQLGAVEVRLAAGLDVRIEARTTLGSVRTRYPSRPDAAAVLHLETELGSVRVRESNRSRSDAGVGGPSWEHDARRWQRQSERWQRRAERHANRWAHAWAHAWGAPPWAAGQAEARPPEPPPRTTAGIPDEELRRVLQLVQNGTLSVEDAEKLLRAMQR